MLICPTCETENPDTNRFCSGCGTGLLAATGQLQPDLVLEDRYKIVKNLGRGGMGAVYLAEDKRLKNSLVAIKEMSSRAVGPNNLKEAIAAFEKEASMLINLRHPSLPRVTDFFSESDERLFLVMDYIEGENLKEVLAKRGKIPQEEVIVWAEQLCQILDYLHTQNPPVIFRDLKPANIMLTPEGSVKLIDFGIARNFQPEQSADTKAYGTEGYVPPEQYGTKQTDARSDLYALGVTLHQLLTGSDPSQSQLSFEKPSKTVKVHKELEEAIMKAVELKPGDRPQTAKEMLAIFASRIKLKGAAKEEVDSKQVLAGDLTDVLSELVFDTDKDTSVIDARQKNETTVAKDETAVIKDETTVLTEKNKHEKTTKINQSSKDEGNKVNNVNNVKNIDNKVKKKSGGFKGVAVLLLLGLIGVGGWFGYTKFFGSGDTAGLVSSQNEEDASGAGEVSDQSSDILEDSDKEVDGANIQEGFFENMVSEVWEGKFAGYYNFNGSEGQQIEVDMISSDFDSYLELLRPDGTVLSNDNDGGGSSNSRIQFTLPNTGTYTVRATQTARVPGKYTLQGNVKLSPSEETREQNKVQATKIFSIEAKFDNIVSQSYDGSYAGYYHIKGVAGQQLRVDMTSLDFDSYLYLLRPDGSSIIDDNNSAGDRNARIEYYLPSDGTYIVMATQTDRSKGNYSLRSNIEIAPDPATKLQNDPKAPIYTVTGGFTASGTEVLEDKYVKYYVIDGNEGQQARIEMSSLEFDSYLEILRPDGSRLADDNNGAGDRNARIEVILPLKGSYLVRATQTERAPGNFSLVSNLPIKVK